MTVERAIELMQRVGNALPELDELIIEDLEDDEDDAVTNEDRKFITAICCKLGQLLR
jgi:hypothetical protein